MSTELSCLAVSVNLVHSQIYLAETCYAMIRPRLPVVIVGLVGLDSLTAGETAWRVSLLPFTFAIEIFTQSAGGRLPLQESGLRSLPRF